MKFLKNYFFSDQFIKTQFIKQFKNKILKKELAFVIYEQQIIAVALFLYISSCYIYESDGKLPHRSSKKHKPLHFDWKIYLKLLHTTHTNNFLICAIKFLWETGRMTRNFEQIDKFISFDKTTFKSQYIYSLSKNKLYKFTNHKEFDFNFEKYKSLIEESLKISEIIETLSGNPENVVDLIASSTSWKNGIFEIFKNKSEYIVFAFFVNLNFKM